VQKLPSSYVNPYPNDYVGQRYSRINTEYQRRYYSHVKKAKDGVCCCKVFCVSNDLNPSYVTANLRQLQAHEA
jgi:hypothetical protein